MILYEFELYEPMRIWLHEYLVDNYKGYHISTHDTHSERLDRFLNKLGIRNDAAIGIDIQIDVLGIAEKNNEYKFFIIEAKKNNLMLKDLGQLWVYCKLINPEEAFLFSSAGFGTLDKVLKIFHREDLLDYSTEKEIKKIKVGVWDVSRNSPNSLSIIPKI